MVKSQTPKPFYYYNDITNFNEKYKDSTKNILILFDSYTSSIKYSYTNWLESDSVKNFLIPNFLVFIFNIEDISKQSPISIESYQFLEKFNPELGYPHLTFINKKREVKTVPKECYYHSKNENAIISFLESLK